VVAAVVADVGRVVQVVAVARDEIAVTAVGRSRPVNLTIVTPASAQVPGWSGMPADGDPAGWPETVPLALGVEVGSGAVGGGVVEEATVPAAA